MQIFSWEVNLDLAARNVGWLSHNRGGKIFGRPGIAGRFEEAVFRLVLYSKLTCILGRDNTIPAYEPHPF